MAAERDLADALEAVEAPFAAEKRAGKFHADGRSRGGGPRGPDLGALADFDPRKARLPAQTAFWLNVHNACVLRDALELHVDGFAARSRVRVAGAQWSLQDIEHGLLRGMLKRTDPRAAYIPVAYDER